MLPSGAVDPIGTRESMAYKPFKLLVVSEVSISTEAIERGGTGLNVAGECENGKGLPYPLAQYHIHTVTYQLIQYHVKCNLNGTKVQNCNLKVIARNQLLYRNQGLGASE